MNIAYVRVSTVDQNETRQTEALSLNNIDKWFIEKITGKDTMRPELQLMLSFAREGDTIFVHDFSRLARSTSDLLQLVNQMQAKGINLVSNKEKFDTSTATGKLMLTVIGAINEFERDNLLERQKEGIEIAKREGKYKGRKPINIAPSFFEEHYARYQRREINKSQLTKILGVTRPTTDKLIREYKVKNSSPFKEGELP
ncbi:MAG TPA: recombinase family protein [Anaerovoracaceae bacterium]|nr:recombinase family protein [Anaerovoracaceae bacterium]